MTSWVDEFNSFQSTASPGGILGIASNSAAKNALIKKRQSRAEKIQAELKLLEWHKLANDAALKAALLQTKTLKEAEPSPSKSVHKDAKWVRKVIAHEQTKPLEVSRHYMLEYEKAEQEKSDRLGNQVERHIATLNKIRSKLEARAELQSRTEEYREWRKEFSSIKQDVMNGKTISPEKARISTPVKDTMMGSTRSGELATVIDSLQKLADLENRISTLEKDNVFERLKKADEDQLLKERQALEFTKKRSVDPLSHTVRTVYAVQKKKVVVQSKRNPRAAAAKKSTFITESITNDANKRTAAQRERQRQLAMASAGQKNLMARVQKKKQREADIRNQQQRHQQAMNNINKRRDEQKQRMEHKLPFKGASVGRKYKNKYLEEFQNMKNEHRKRKEEKHVRISSTVNSNTMPPVAKPAVNRRQPTTKTGGTVTRKVKTVPSRKQQSGLGMPPIVGTGVGAVRGIRDMRNKGGRK